MLSMALFIRPLLEVAGDEQIRLLLEVSVARFCIDGVGVRGCGELGGVCV